MGITGLLPLLKPIHQPINLREYKGKTIGVDGYIWLHKSAFGCAYDLCMGNPTTKYVKYCMKKVFLLMEAGITPYIVFDGGSLPMKKATQEQRRISRGKKLAQGKQYVLDGNGTKATECFQGCTSVTSEMAHEWIKELRIHKIKFVVAPYEADAQLAYLCQQEKVSAVITEDSDLLAFGCADVIFKLDDHGNGISIKQQDFGSMKEMRFWTIDRFRQMCILSGCDYLDSPPGIGIKKALGLLHRKDAYDVIKLWMNWGKSVKAPTLVAGYLELFTKAHLTFLHQRVYDPTLKGIVPLTPLADALLDDEVLSHEIGPHLDGDIAQGVAEGNLNPFTKLPFDGATEIKRITVAESPFGVQEDVGSLKRRGTPGAAKQLLSSNKENIPPEMLESMHVNAIASLQHPNALSAPMRDVPKMLVKSTALKPVGFNVRSAIGTKPRSISKPLKLYPVSGSAKPFPELYQVKPNDFTIITPESAPRRKSLATSNSFSLQKDKKRPKTTINLVSHYFKPKNIH